MIEMVSPMPVGGGALLRLHPPRALTARQFVWLFVALTGVMWLVTGLGWLAGNVLAPFFALLHSALVAAALRWSWRSGGREEDIAIGPDAVEVHRSGAIDAVFRAHPYWVRLRVEGDEGRVLLVSSGRQVEVGGFLGPAERGELAGRLDGLLAAASGRNR